MLEVNPISNPSNFSKLFSRGAEGARTLDLLNAINTASISNCKNTGTYNICVFSVSRGYPHICVETVSWRAISSDCN